MKKILFLLLLPIASFAQLQFGNGTGTATGAITTQNLNPLTGVPTAGSFVRFDLLNQATVNINVAGTYTGALSIQLSQDNGTTWQTVTNALAVSNQVTNATSATIASGAVGAFLVNVAGWESVRVSALAAVTGTANVRIKAISNNFFTVFNAPLPAGTNIIGALSANQSVNVAQINGVTPLMGNGVTGTGSQRVTISSDNTAFTVNLGTSATAATNLGKAEDAVSGSGDVGVFSLGVQRAGPTLSSQNAAGDYSEMAVDDGGAMWIRNRPLTYSRLTADGQVKATAGHLQTLTFSPTGAVVAGVISIYDSATETGTIIFSCSLPVTTFTPFSVTLNVAALTAIYVGYDATVTNVQVTTTFR